MKIHTTSIVAAVLTACANASTPEENARLAQELFRQPAQDFARAQQQQSNTLLAAAKIRAEMTQQDRAHQLQRDLLEAEHKFQLEMERRREVRARKERDQETAQNQPRTAANVPQHVALETVVPPEAQKLFGLEKLSPEERQMLAAFLAKQLNATYQIGLEEGKSRAPSSMPSQR